MDEGQERVESTVEASGQALSGGDERPSEGAQQSPDGNGARPSQEDIPEPAVPWGKFREVQTTFTQFKRQMAEERQKWLAEQEALRKELEDLRRVRDDFQAIEALLDDNPEIADQLYELAKTGSAVPRSVATKASPRGSTPPELESLVKDVQELKQLIQGERQQVAAQMEAERMRQLAQELDSTLTGLLNRAGMDPAWLSHARGYVLERARELPGLEMSDVPYLFAEWRKPMQELLNRQLQAWRQGKSQDRFLPPTGGGGPVPPAAEGIGGNDGKTVHAVAELLRNRGWGR